MTAAIMQPTYLPWAGYFNLIGRVSTFVFLDDVQFAKPSWQMRNRILHRGQPLLLSVPTLGSRHQRLMDVRLAGDEFRSNHRRTLEHAYQKHPFGGEVLAVVLPILADPFIERLADLNMAIIERLARNLGFVSQFRRSSELCAGGKRSLHLLEILTALHETAYLSPEGAREYITEEQAFARSKVKLEYQAYSPATYAQRGATTFVSHLSVVDVIANLGFAAARTYVLESQTFAQQGEQPITRIGDQQLGLPLSHAAAFVG